MMQNKERRAYNRIKIIEPVIVRSNTHPKSMIFDVADISENGMKFRTSRQDLSAVCIKPNDIIHFQLVDDYLLDMTTDDIISGEARVVYVDDSLGYITVGCYISSEFYFEYVSKCKSVMKKDL